MRAIVKGALIGGGVGALVTTVQATRAEEDPPETVALAALKGAAEGALAGGLIGGFFEWRQARAEPEPATLPAAALASAREALDAARPHVESAAGQARDLARDAVEAARPHVESAAELAAPHIQELVDEARRRVPAIVESTIGDGPTIVVRRPAA